MITSAGRTDTERQDQSENRGLSRSKIILRSLPTAGFEPSVSVPAACDVSSIVVRKPLHHSGLRYHELALQLYRLLNGSDTYNFELI